MSHSKALVVFSGGQDSTTCLYWAKERFEEVATLGFYYGQKHALETEVARQLAAEAQVPFHLMDVSFIAQLSSNALTHTDMKMDEAIPEGKAKPNTFVLGRNHFFLSIAAVYAIEQGISHIVTGVSQTDFSGYPDCRDNFIKSLNVTLNLAMDAELVIHTPLMWITKADTWALADRLGIVELIHHRTLTCYNGIMGDGCGHCPACRLRRDGWLQYQRTRALTS